MCRVLFIFLFVKLGCISNNVQWRFTLDLVLLGNLPDGTENIFLLFVSDRKLENNVDTSEDRDNI